MLYSMAMYVLHKINMSIHILNNFSCKTFDLYILSVVCSLWFYTDWYFIIVCKWNIL